HTLQDDAAFTSVASGPALLNTTLQEYPLPGGPVRARYLKLLAKNSYTISGVAVDAFEAATVATEGNILSLPPAAANALLNESPAQIANGAAVVYYSSALSAVYSPTAILNYVWDYTWTTTSTAGQSLVVQLAGG